MSLDIEEFCIRLHEAYELAAQENGWETQAESRVPWDGVPEENKQTMRDAIRSVLPQTVAQPLRDLAEEMTKTCEPSCFHANSHCHYVETAKELLDKADSIDSAPIPTEDLPVEEEGWVGPVPDVSFTSDEPS